MTKLRRVDDTNSQRWRMMRSWTVTNIGGKRKARLNGVKLALVYGVKNIKNSPARKVTKKDAGE